jgi:hypothetical protein
MGTESGIPKPWQTGRNSVCRRLAVRGSISYILLGTVFLREAIGGINFNAAVNLER